MKLKDKLIKKLLNFGKKHRIMVYPTLALIAIISACSHMVCWGRGNGKRVMASLMIMTMLVTQSFIFTSSADQENIASEAPVSEEPQPYDVGTSPTVKVNYYRVDDEGIEYPTLTVDANTTDNGDGTYSADIIAPDIAALCQAEFGDGVDTTCFTLSALTIVDSVGGSTLPQASYTVTDADGDNILDPVKVTYTLTRNKYPITVTGYDTPYSGYIDILSPVTGNIDPSVSYKLLTEADYNAYKLGYRFNGLVYNDASYIISDTDEVMIPIAPVGYISSVDMTAQWTPMKYIVNYVAIDDGTVSWPAELVCPSQITLNGASQNVQTSGEFSYGDTSSPLVSASGIWAGNEAYIFNGWYYNGDIYTTVSDALAVANGDLNDLADGVNIKGVTLYANWTYKDVSINVNGSQINLTSEGAAIAGTYGDAIDVTIAANYKSDNTAGTKFTYELGTVDGIPGAQILANYGLNFASLADVGSGVPGIRIDGIFDDVTEGTYENGVTIPLIVTDANNAENPTYTFYINVNIAKKEVSVDPTSIKRAENSSEAPQKEYNGETAIEVYPKVEVTGYLGNDEIFVEITSATLEDANAGTAKTIFLNNPTLKGAHSKYYKLTDVVDSKIRVEGVANVSKKSIPITLQRIDGLDTPVGFGQADPKYRIIITDPTALAGEANVVGSDEYKYMNIPEGNDAAREQFMGDVLGFTSWQTTRKLYDPDGDYEISPAFANANYDIVKTGSTAVFTVKREEAVADVDYKYSTTKASNGYYPGLTITPLGTGKLIKLLDDSETDITNATPNPTGNFATSIVIDNCVDKTIRFLILDTDTGSITKVVTDTVSVDNSVPAYSSHEVTEDVKGYINQFNFGSYYHKQNNIEYISIKFIFNAEYSDCDKLCYYFIPEGSATPGAVIQEPMTRITGTNNYEGTIKFGTAQNGELYVYATNSTGGASPTKKIKFDTAEDPGIGEYYEWMIENNEMAISDIVVTDIDGNTASANDSWYNGLKFELPAEDTESGVWKIEWIITDEEGNLIDIDEGAVTELNSLSAVSVNYGKLAMYTFRAAITSSDLPVGEYTISANVYDNAGNKTEAVAVGPFKVDCNPPEIDDTTLPAAGSYQSDVTFKFTVTEGANESGIKSVELYDITDGYTEGDSPVKSYAVADEYTYKIEGNGTYRVIATDNAGNVTTYDKVFDSISESVPDKPVIDVTGTIGSDNWYYKDSVVIHISTTTETSDNVPVETGYKITYSSNGSTNSGTIPELQASDFQIPVTEDGTITVEAWSTSAAGKYSGSVTKTIKVDTNAPVVTIEESTVNPDGSINVNYKVVDDTSGVDTVLINGEEAEVTEEDGVITGTFTVTESKEYLISATDMAGNKSTDKGFTPLSIEASPVLDIKPNSAKLIVDIFEGTYDIDDYYIVYKKQTAEDYSTAFVNEDDTVDYGVHAECIFNNLSADTVYDYKVYAITKTSKEIQTIEGSFKTSNNTDIASIRGTVTYDDSIPDTYEKYPVYVSIYEGNTFIAGTKLTSPDEDNYIFNNLKDGTYRIVATDGLFTKTKKVVIENNGIKEPDSYLVDNGVNFVLNGMSTEVIIEDNSINISADGLDKVFDPNSIYGNVITDDDRLLIADGGSVNIALHAKYIGEGELTDGEAASFEKNMDEDAIIKKYISLTIVKTVRDKDGILIGEPELIPALYDAISVSFPLGELSGQRVYVAATHREATGKYSFHDWDDAIEAALTERYVTISTNLFSVYALYIMDEPPKTFVVKWIDGDGKIIKNEVVEEGKSAVPPTVTPTKSPSEHYTYKFSGWDRTYDVVVEDMIIAARFTAHKKETEKPDDNKPTTSPDEDKAPDATIEPGDKDDDGKDDNPQNKPPEYTYMGNADSPQTGDETPIMVLMLALLISGVGVVYLRKRTYITKD